MLNLIHTRVNNFNTQNFRNFSKQRAERKDADRAEIKSYQPVIESTNRVP